MGGSQANIELWALPAAVPDLASLGQYRLSEIVAPAYADADIAKIGRASEIARRYLVDMVRLHHLGSASCALLTMSSEQFVCRLQAHADVKLPDMSHY